MASPESSFEQKPLGSIPIQKLGLTIAGTRLEPLIREFEGELEKLGLKVRPRIYLSTEWGVPFGSTTIAMPFYLARPELTELQGAHRHRRRTESTRHPALPPPRDGPRGQL